MSSTNTRFDVAIIDQAKEMAEKLIEHKEIRSVAIVVDWDLPAPAGAALNLGYWKPQKDSDVFTTTTGMQIQLAKLSQYLGTVILDGMRQLRVGAKLQESDAGKLQQESEKQS